MDDIAVLGFSAVTGPGGKDFTIFNIFVTTSGRIHHVKKRYSELLHVHKELKKLGHVPTFPPKNVRNQNRQVIEARRQALHKYYQTILRTTNLKETLFDLLDVPRITPLYNQVGNGTHIRTSTSSSTILSEDGHPQHGRILYFNHSPKDMCIDAIINRPNNVVTGVLKGIYEA